MSKCPKCQTRKAKRRCPALAAEICPRCCGEHRLRTIPCPRDCPHLEGELYQQERRRERATLEGREFIAGLKQRFDDGDEFSFAMAVSGDLYFYSSNAGRLGNARIIGVLEGVRGMLSKIFVPDAAAAPAVRYLVGRIERSARYDVSPAFSDRDRVRVIDVLISWVRDAEARHVDYEEELERFFSHFDLGRDMGIVEDDFEALGGNGHRAGAGDGLRRSAGGVILPP